MIFVLLLAGLQISETFLK